MGKLALAAKITHVPSMYLSELPGKHHGCRQAAINGHLEISRRCREQGVDTLIVFDTHWLVNSAYHIIAVTLFPGFIPVMNCHISFAIWLMNMRATPRWGK